MFIERFSTVKRTVDVHIEVYPLTPFINESVSIYLFVIRTICFPVSPEVFNGNGAARETIISRYKTYEGIISEFPFI